MSTSSNGAETCDIDFSTEQQWVVHHVLVTRADEALDNREAPPTWLVELVARIESELDHITESQARRLIDELTDYVELDDTPDADVDVASSLVDELEASLED